MTYYTQEWALFADRQIKQLECRIEQLERQLEDQEAELGAYRQDGGERINAVLAEIPPALLAQKNKEIDDLQRQLDDAKAEIRTLRNAACERPAVSDEPTEAMLEAGQQAGWPNRMNMNHNAMKYKKILRRAYLAMRRAALEAGDE